MSNVITLPIGIEREWREQEGTFREIFEMWGVLPLELADLLKTMRFHWEQHRAIPMSLSYDLPGSLTSEESLSVSLAVQSTSDAIMKGWNDSSARALVAIAKLEFEAVRQSAGCPPPFD